MKRFRLTFVIDAPGPLTVLDWIRELPAFADNDRKVTLVLFNLESEG